MDKRYAVVEITEWYGPSATYALISEYDDFDAAYDAAAAHNPDYRPDAGCCELAHDQAAARCGKACEIVARGAVADDWGLWPCKAVDACDGVDPEDGEAITAALEAAGYVIFDADDDQIMAAI